MKSISQEYDTFVKHLIILSYSKEKQLNLIGSGEENVAGEIAINFGISYVYIEDFYNSEIINSHQKTTIENFYNFINDSNDGYIDSEAWNTIRDRANNVLNILDISNFIVELNNSGKFCETKLNK
ncbi:hypothetical protein FLAN108750_12000 [Flavobacterium antarcticum]|uniref:hypothetical protein n=1 Tax=Flavobacterium antarcticum TaxID=271155 RepID=UPI0003B533F6|nr:hypothetical protein [Flavobacterium antarcticum]